MANRHLSRSIALQTLFEIDFRDWGTSVVQTIITRNILEFAPETSDFVFIENLVKGVLDKKDDLNKIIEKAAPDWPIDRIAISDRNVLRLGLFELLFADRREVPAKVAINEAIELAKTFGGDNSGRFVNGVLGAVYKELGEPDKEAISKKKQREIKYENMPILKLCGAVVYALKEGEIFMAFVHDVFGHWTLSKGKLLEGEDEKVGVVRKMKEELDLSVEVVEELGRNEYIASDPEKGKQRKQVIYFLVKSDFLPIKLGVTGGLDDAKWFSIKDIAGLNFYNDILPLITKAVTIIK